MKVGSNNSHPAVCLSWGKAKADIVPAIGRLVPVAHSGPGIPAVVVPTTAATDTVLAI